MFGLFHGMGFAGGLAALGYAKQDLAAALVFFNLGVELGQLGFIALVLLLGAGRCRALNRRAAGRLASVQRVGRRRSRSGICGGDCGRVLDLPDQRRLDGDRLE